MMDEFCNKMVGEKGRKVDARVTTAAGPAAWSAAIGFLGAVAITRTLIDYEVLRTKVVDLQARLLTEQPELTDKLLPAIRELRNEANNELLFGILVSGLTAYYIGCAVYYTQKRRN